MELPVDCVAGETCWIVNYVDHDPTKGLKDYACGKATYNAQPTDQHKGTDIAIRDLAVMRRGVAVLATAPGVVAGARDSLDDVSIRKIGAAAGRARNAATACASITATAGRPSTATCGAVASGPRRGCG